MRGYGYQQLGPKDLDGDPIGGRGLAEFGARGAHPPQAVRRQFRRRALLRRRLADHRRRCPDFKDWRFAAGVGVRYYSSFGPIRVDFGVPLNRQKGDGPFAVTVSLGQAF